MRRKICWVVLFFLVFFVVVVVVVVVVFVVFNAFEKLINSSIAELTGRKPLGHSKHMCFC